MMFFMGLKFVYKLQLLAQYWRYKNDGGSFSRLIQIRTSEGGVLPGPPQIVVGLSPTTSDDEP